MMKESGKIKIFLGAYVNLPNAQNINCDNIALNLDKDKFEVHVMYIPKKPIDKEKYRKAGIILHKLWHRRYVWHFSKYFQMKKANCDIYYLPKREPSDFKFARKFKSKGKVFVSSIESVITNNTGNFHKNKEYFLNIMHETFAISNCIRQSVKSFYGADFPMLPLGVADRLISQFVFRKSIKNVIWVGNVKANKRPQLLLECAKFFPSLNFTMVGDGDMFAEIQNQISEGINNVTLTGRVSNEKVYEYMSRSDLLLMTSEFEGLPKVIQEAAQNSLPSIYINENYSVDFIQSGLNGFAVSNVQEMIDKIQFLLDNPVKYQEMAKNAYDTIQDYRWSVLIKDYENYFQSMFQSKRG